MKIFIVYFETETKTGVAILELQNDKYIEDALEIFERDWPKNYPQYGRIHKATCMVTTQDLQVVYIDNK